MHVIKEKKSFIRKGEEIESKYATELISLLSIENHKCMIEYSCPCIIIIIFLVVPNLTCFCLARYELKSYNF